MNYSRNEYQPKKRLDNIIGSLEKTILNFKNDNEGYYLAKELYYCCKSIKDYIILVEDGSGLDTESIGGLKENIDKIIEDMEIIRNNIKHLNEKIEINTENILKILSSDEIINLKKLIQQNTKDIININNNFSQTQLQLTDILKKINKTIEDISNILTNITNIKTDITSLREEINDQNVIIGAIKIDLDGNIKQMDVIKEIVSTVQVVVDSFDERLVIAENNVQYSLTVATEAKDLITSIDVKIEGIIEHIISIETIVDNARDLSNKAIVNANKANDNAELAIGVANGVDAKANRALERAEEAIELATNAETYAKGIEDKVNEVLDKIGAVLGQKDIGDYLSPIAKVGKIPVGVGNGSLHNSWVSALSNEKVIYTNRIGTVGKKDYGIGIYPSNNIIIPDRSEPVIGSLKAAIGKAPLGNYLGKIDSSWLENVGSSVISIYSIKKPGTKNFGIASY